MSRAAALEVDRDMPDKIHMASPVAVLDALNSLLEAEQNSVFRFMGEGSPYLNRASAEIRRPLQQMVETSYRHCGQLYGMIEDLGGIPRPSSIEPEEQYLAFLSLKFLLPKLVEAKRLTIQRYENTLKAIGNAIPNVQALLESHLADHREELGVLQKAAEQVAANK
jgi:bacterioferritin (cytochrome b1)